MATIETPGADRAKSPRPLHRLRLMALRAALGSWPRPPACAQGQQADAAAELRWQASRWRPGDAPVDWLARHASALAEALAPQPSEAPEPLGLARGAWLGACALALLPHAPPHEEDCDFEARSERRAAALWTEGSCRPEPPRRARERWAAACAGPAAFSLANLMAQASLLPRPMRAAARLAAKAAWLPAAWASASSRARRHAQIKLDADAAERAAARATAQEAALWLGQSSNFHAPGLPEYDPSFHWEWAGVSARASQPLAAALRLCGQAAKLLPARERAVAACCLLEGLCGCLASSEADRLMSAPARMPTIEFLDAAWGSPFPGWSPTARSACQGALASRGLLRFASPAAFRMPWTRALCSAIAKASMGQPLAPPALPLPAPPSPAEPRLSRPRGGPPRIVQRRLRPGEPFCFPPADGRLAPARAAS